VTDECLVDASKLIAAPAQVKRLSEKNPWSPQNYNKWTRLSTARFGPSTGVKPAEVDTTQAGSEVKYRRVSELTGLEPPLFPKFIPAGYRNGHHNHGGPIPETSFETVSTWWDSLPETGGVNYFAAGPRPRRRAATRDDMHYASSLAATYNSTVGVNPLDLEFKPNPVIFAHLVDATIEETSSVGNDSEQSRKPTQTTENQNEKLRSEDDVNQRTRSDGVALSCMDSGVANAPIDLEMSDTSGSEDLVRYGSSTADDIVSTALSLATTLSHTSRVDKGRTLASGQSTLLTLSVLLPRYPSTHNPVPRRLKDGLLRLSTYLLWILTIGHQG
jgi:hypothetical protein